ncbi:phosphoribosylaminoimidazolecarboxamide formyltransferase / IMP cyclohydrolase [Candidatus Gastranaerophilus sp. (ex Termes propinquus)]|nr:phosphoribosylaminoimidazolecarboxamide formyltransferase / IMP cyclohydrolase [Candidatus Gastranaerophilus sp. (ex Termes propinquus)]
MKKRAYISVFDKTGVVDLAKRLTASGWEIVSTGNTCALLNENGIEAVESATITGFSELLGGKVKSLHPKIFAGILANEQETKTLDFPPFSLVVVNLYPFENYRGKNADLETLLKNIDIGGVSLLRAGAKNFENVAVVCDVADYGLDFDNLQRHERESLALKVFQTTSGYDFLIFDELSKNFGAHPGLSNIESLRLTKLKDLRYGENPHQSAALYKEASNDILDYEFLNGKEFSYNNIADATAALDVASEFYDVCACAIIKHANPCGVALGATLLESWEKALDCDPLSAFGGIVAFTREVDETLAKRLAAMFLEVIIAPSYTDGAVEILKTKKNLRVVKLNTELSHYKRFVAREVRLTPFGGLIQQKDVQELNCADFKVVTKQKPTQEQVEDMIFAFKVAKHVRSNAIVVARDLKTLGICGGQTSRVGAVEIALSRVCDSTRDAVLASDGFFPATDNIEIAASNRIAAIIQPGGSIKDEDVIKLADKHSLVMINTGIRHFKH